MADKKENKDMTLMIDYRKLNYEVEYSMQIANALLKVMHTTRTQLISQLNNLTRKKNKNDFSSVLTIKCQVIINQVSNYPCRKIGPEISSNLFK